MADLPIVCTLTPDALRARREGLLAELLRQSTDHELLAEGLRLRFPPSGDTLASIARDARHHAMPRSLAADVHIAVVCIPNEAVAATFELAVQRM